MTGSLADLLADALACPGAALAGEDGAVPGAAVLDQAGSIASGLRAHGAPPDQPVLLTIGNRPSDLAGLLGIWRAGGVAIPLHHTTPPAVRERLQEQTGARLLVDGRDPRALASSPPPPRDLLTGAALILFTSGTTGAPKGAVLGHERFRDKLLALQRLLTIRPDDRVVVPIQLTFIYGLWVSLLALHAGARLVLVPRFRVDGAAALLANTTVLASVPTMLRGLAVAPPPAPDLRLILSGGEFLGSALADRVCECWPGAGLVDLYGLTETGACDFFARTADRVVASGSIGRPTEGVAFRIAAEPGEASGELRIKSPFGMLGYLDDPALTAAAFDDGFFRTGDLARVRADGRVEIAGRIKEIVVRGGVKISPLEIENLFQRHPSVTAALCAGVPDPRRGEAVHVMLVARPGHDLDPERLHGWAAERIERHKLPDRIHIGDTLPLGATGKADRAALRRLLVAG